nr:hypothetical protein [Saccharopolyspora sp. ASAGF58]
MVEDDGTELLRPSRCGDHRQLRPQETRFGIDDAGVGGPGQVLRESLLQLGAVQEFVVEAGRSRRGVRGDQRGRIAGSEDQAPGEVQEATPGRALQSAPEVQRMQRERGEARLALALHGEPPRLPGERASVVPDAEPFVAVDTMAAHCEPPRGHGSDRAETDHGDVGCVLRCWTHGRLPQAAAVSHSAIRPGGG